MSEIGEVYESYRKNSQDKRAHNRENSAKVLKDNSIHYQSKNGGAHLIIKYCGKVVDFWPGTGKYTVRGGVTGRGVYNLLKLLI